MQGASRRGGGPGGVSILAALLAAAAGLVVLNACSAPEAAGGAETAHIALPPAGAVFDYQLGGAYAPREDVRTVARDREDPPAAGLYSICYVNAFQTQPGERDLWPDELLLRVDGAPVVDPAWPDEILLDLSSPEQRDGIARIVAPWIERCARDGYAAVEFDNLDTYDRSSGALRFADTLSLARRLVSVAHENGLAAGQKNSAEASRALHERAGFDFAIAESCAAFDECRSYAEAYADRVLDIEYANEIPRPFSELCADGGRPASMILRDHDLEPPDSGAYVFEACESPLA